MKKTILVIGGTGMLGQPVSLALKEAGFEVRIMTRDQIKANRIFGNSFEIFTEDPIDIMSLKAAMQGCSGVHISLPTEVEQQVAENVAHASARLGIEHITYISGATVAEKNRWFSMVNRKYLAEKALRGTDVPCTILCPTWVMQGLAMFVNQGKAAVFGKQLTPYHWVAAEDIARMVSKAYEIGAEATGRFIVHGPEAIDMREALRHYCAVFHPEIKDVTSMPFWMVKVLVAFTGNHGLKGAGELMSYFEKIGEGDLKPQESCIIGKPTITLDRWLQERKVKVDSYRIEKKDLNLATVG